MVIGKSLQDGKVAAAIREWLAAALPAEGAAAGAAHGGAAALADNEDTALRARLSGVAHVGGKGGVFLRHSLQA